MTARPKIEAAQRVAEWLETNGQYKRAEDVRSLCRSMSALGNAARVATLDNYRLREALAERTDDPA